MWLQLMANLIGGLPFMQGKIYGFEHEFLNSVTQNLHKNTANLIDRQIAQVNRVSRLFRSREVNLYCKTNGKLGFAADSLFRNRTDVMQLACIKLGRSEDNKKLEVKIWVVAGHVFEFRYNKAPKEFFGVHRLASIQPSSIECELIDDPQILRIEKYITIPLEADAKERASAVLQRPNVDNLINPFGRESLKLYLQQLKTALPADFVELLHITNGCHVDGWHLFGALELRQVTLESGEILLLAELAGVGALAVKESSKSRALIFVDYVDDAQIGVEGDLVSAMRIVEIRAPIT
jgi:hypothetical protein